MDQLTALIRISALPPSSGTPPFFGNDKFSLVKACNKSFMAAGDCNRVYFLDRCPQEYIDYFSQFGEVFQGSWDKKQSLYAVYDFARRRNFDGSILFLEDDYLWRPGTLQGLQEGLNKFGLVSPYDHRGHYGVNEKVCMGMQVVGNLVWRDCLTNTHTFAVKAELFREHIDDFYYGLHDWQMFFKLHSLGVRLYCPTYSMATHLVQGQLAPNVDWQQVADSYRELQEIIPTN